MSGQEPTLPDRAAELRREFDRSFAEAPAGERAPLEDFLAIRIGPDPYAVRLAEISGLFADRAVTPLPAPIPELLGITGIRGLIVAVYDLRVLLGYPAGQNPRWLMVAAETPVGLAFDAFDAHLRLPRGSGSSAESAEDTRPYTRGVLSAGDVVRPVVHLASVLGEIKRRAQAAVATKED